MEALGGPRRPQPPLLSHGGVNHRGVNGTDRLIADLATSQYGLVTRGQLLSAGLSVRSVDHRVNQGALVVVHPGTYALPGSHRSWHREQLAACLWSKGVAGVRAAAFLHGLPGFEDPPIEVVTTLNKRPMPRCGVTCHHTTRLPGEQVTSVQGIPITSIERTLLDLCGHVAKRRAAIALDHALHGGKTTLGSLDRCLYLTARRGRDGCAVLRELVHQRLNLEEYPNSPLETVIFGLLASSGLPMPKMQQPIFDDQSDFVARPDFLWPDHKLIVEGHSKLWHEGLMATVSDRKRHERLARLGHRILYVTWADATRFGSATLKLIERALDGDTDVENLRWDVVRLAENG